MPREMRHALGKKDESLRVVRVIESVLSIQSGAFKEFRLLDEI